MPHSLPGNGLIALGILLLWMHADARANGTPFVPYLLITLAIGIAGPLGYLIHREVRLRRMSGSPLDTHVRAGA